MPALIVKQHHSNRVTDHDVHKDVDDDNVDGGANYNNTILFPFPINRQAKHQSKKLVLTLLLDYLESTFEQQIVGIGAIIIFFCKKIQLK